jgi:hypothetical protein
VTVSITRIWRFPALAFCFSTTSRRSQRKNYLQANTTAPEISVIAKARIAQCDLETFARSA